MVDREKVIKGLEICTTRPCYCTDCPYKKDCVLDSQEVMEDALALLKEQEAVEPITEHRLFLCPVCKNTLFRKQKFCHECGKRIKWEWR